MTLSLHFLSQPNLSPTTLFDLQVLVVVAVVEAAVAIHGADSIVEEDLGFKKLEGVVASLQRGPSPFSQALRFHVVGDGLLMSNPKRIERAIQKSACDALLLKVYALFNNSA
ncbi:hypothetical protein L1987_69154 [Smallanthus sonchifolius]|uniref:Uncharacterized protein n=1 Tax=Smallanthus sonchifolius TaxID=185202 RepID=A0ACB9B555_9ASTR|nr:hypothetical protein L1987_69154 [Smallanthus sonchifolius]